MLRAVFKFGVQLRDSKRHTENASAAACYATNAAVNAFLFVTTQQCTAQKKSIKSLEPVFKKVPPATFALLGTWTRKRYFGGCTRKQ